MNNFELEYAQLINRILQTGEYREGRNGGTQAIFGQSLIVDMSGSDYFPLLLGRKIFYKGIFGELAALLRGPKHLDDFKRFDCNYWDLWAKPDGSINIDYGNLWLDWNGTNQLRKLIDTLKSNPTDRRMMISSWKPDTLDELDLPCCHYCYQWFVRGGQYLDMIWMQRSCDTMIGLPSDIVLAALMNVLIANEVGLQPGKIKMDLGDTHIYEEHIEKAYEYMSSVYFNVGNIEYPRYKLVMNQGQKVETFTPTMISIIDYNPVATMKFELKA